MSVTAPATIASASALMSVSDPHGTRRCLDILRTAGMASVGALEPLVREHAVFSCDVGTPTSRLRRQWPDFDFGDLPEVWWPQEDETEADVLGRCERFRRSAARMPDWTDILVVSHWGFIRGLTGAELANGAMLRFDPMNAEASAVVDPARSC